MIFIQIVIKIALSYSMGYDDGHRAGHYNGFLDGVTEERAAALELCECYCTGSCCASHIQD